MPKYIQHQCGKQSGGFVRRAFKKNIHLTPEG